MTSASRRFGRNSSVSRGKETRYESVRKSRAWLFFVRLFHSGTWREEKIRQLVISARATKRVAAACPHVADQRSVRLFAGEPRFSPRPLSGGGNRECRAGA